MQHAGWLVGDMELPWILLDGHSHAQNEQEKKGTMVMVTITGNGYYYLVTSSWWLPLRTDFILVGKLQDCAQPQKGSAD